MLDQTFLSSKQLCPTFIETGSQRGGGCRCGASIIQHRIPNAHFGSINIGSQHVANIRHEIKGPVRAARSCAGKLEKFVVNYVPHVAQQQDHICHLHIRKRCLDGAMGCFVSGLLFRFHALCCSIDPVLGVAGGLSQPVQDGQHTFKHAGFRNV